MRLKQATAANKFGTACIQMLPLRSRTVHIDGFDITLFELDARQYHKIPLCFLMTACGPIFALGDLLRTTHSAKA
jgi:hypothetical protein